MSTPARPFAAPPPRTTLAAWRSTGCRERWRSRTRSRRSPTGCSRSAATPARAAPHRLRRGDLPLVRRRQPDPLVVARSAPRPRAGAAARLRLASRARSAAGRYRVTADRAFERRDPALRGAARGRARTAPGSPTEMIDAYERLHRLGFAHSFEAWEGEALAGGLYGVSLGGAFFGESMFARPARRVEGRVRPRGRVARRAGACGSSIARCAPSTSRASARASSRARSSSRGSRARSSGRRCAADGTSTRPSARLGLRRRPAAGRRCERAARARSPAPRGAVGAARKVSRRTSVRVGHPGRKRGVRGGEAVRLECEAMAERSRPGGDTDVVVPRTKAEKETKRPSLFPRAPAQRRLHDPGVRRVGPVSGVSSRRGERDRIMLHVHMTASASPVSIRSRSPRRRRRRRCRSRARRSTRSS